SADAHCLPGFPAARQEALPSFVPEGPTLSAETRSGRPISELPPLQRRRPRSASPPSDELRPTPKPSPPTTPTTRAHPKPVGKPWRASGTAWKARLRKATLAVPYEPPL